MAAANRLPSVDRLARRPDLAGLLEAHGHALLIDCIRAVTERHRPAFTAGHALPDEDMLAAEVASLVGERLEPSLKPVFNLTGTVLHTNLGRAPLPEAAIERAAMAMRGPVNLEYDLGRGRRGERDRLIEGMLADLTGAEAACVVNNNAGAVLIGLAALAGRREVIVSRGELIEIGGSFRIPDIMRCATVKLVEVGTTNRTHAADYENAIGARTGALMKVHPSNYEVRGFVSDVAHAELAAIARARGIPLIVDLGAGSLIDLERLGLPAEPIVSAMIAAGADLVTFSGDKLLGGPQAGLIVGRKALIDRINRHPLKRALRVSKIILAALEAVLLEYRRPDRLEQRLPALRLLKRPRAEIEALASRLSGPLASALGKDWEVRVIDVSSEVGSGSLPLESLPSAALALRPRTRSGAALERLSRRLRALPVPVIGRVADGQLILDLRCLEDEEGFRGQLAALAIQEDKP